MTHIYTHKQTNTHRPRECGNLLLLIALKPSKIMTHTSEFKSKHMPKL